MKNDLLVKNGFIIPGCEIEIISSRSGGSGGQHVNKTDTRITVRWNVKETIALNEEQKKRILEKLKSRLTEDGDLIVHCSTSRSQSQNKEMALARLGDEIRNALYVPKKRMATRVPKAAKASRLQAKTRRSMIKKMRSMNYKED